MMIYASATFCKYLYLPYTRSRQLDNGHIEATERATIIY